MTDTINYIDTAVENFFLHTLEIDSKRVGQEVLENIYTTEIKIADVECEYDFVLCMREPLLNILAQKLLFEESPDQEMLIDLLNESANLIIGNAKVLWEEQEGATLSLTPPAYQGFFEKSFSKELDAKLFFHAGDEPIMIGVQRKETVA